MAHPANTYTLVADIGGTNTRLALADGNTVVPGSVQRYSNADHDSLQNVITQYVAQQGGIDTCAACVAVAGPVEGNSATLTNLDWTIDTDTLARATNAEAVAIINDLQAQGYALGHIPQDNVVSVLVGAEPAAQATQLVIGIGTGFNAAPVFETPSGRFVAPSEAGHADLPIRTAQELHIGHTIADAQGAPSVEDALSGRGLPNIYSALHPTRPPLSSHEVLDQASLGDQAALAAVQQFTQIMGAVCGNLALVHLPFGGVHLVGGMARAMKPFLATGDFERAFRSKGRFAQFMHRFSVNIIEDDYAALIGCAVAMNPQRD